MTLTKYTPRVWQQPVGPHIAKHKRCAVFMKMGGGKTISIAHPLSCIREIDEGPVLVLGPKRVACSTWPGEFAKWESLKHLTTSVITGNVTDRLIALHKPADFYFTNYEQLPWLCDMLPGSQWKFRTIIADECTRLKGHRLNGHGGQRTNALAKVAHERASRFIILSGTPSPNGLQDLWGQMWFLDKGQRLGTSFEAFKNRWFRPKPGGFGLEPFPFAQKEIQEAISDIAISIDPGDYMQIDKPIEVDIMVELPPRARKLYTDMEKRMYMEIEHDFGVHEIEALNAASRTNKCLQLANGAVYTDDRQSWEWVHDAKIEALDSIVEEACGMPLLVAYQFRADVQRILKAFPKARMFDANPETEAAWNRGEIDMLLAHPMSAGHGSNLQWGSNILVDFSSGWDAEGDDQIIERIGPTRQFQAGLNRPVYRYRIMAENTVDLLVKERRVTKKSVQEILFEALKRR